MTTPENIYERIISDRAPSLDQRAKERAIRYLREVDKHRSNLSRIVGPNIGLQLLLDLTSIGLSELFAPKTVRLTTGELADSEYNRANLKSASEKVLSQTFYSYPSSRHFYLTTADQIDKNIADWQIVEENFPPYAGRISLLREIIKRVKRPNKKFYFHKLGPQIHGRTGDLLAIFLNARGLYPIPVPSTTTDYPAESEEIIETLELVAPADNKKVKVTPEEIMGLYLVGSLKVERQFDTFPFTPLSILDLPTRQHNALRRAGAETVEALQWLLLPENEIAFRYIRNVGEKSLVQIKEYLSIYQQNNV